MLLHFRADVEILLEAVLDDGDVGVGDVERLGLGLRNHFAIKGKVGVLVELSSRYQVAGVHAQDIVRVVHLVIELEEAAEQLAQCLVVVLRLVHAVVGVNVPPQLLVEDHRLPALLVLLDCGERRPLQVLQTKYHEHHEAVVAGDHPLRDLILLRPELHNHGEALDADVVAQDVADETRVVVAELRRQVDVADGFRADVQKAADRDAGKQYQTDHSEVAAVASDELIDLLQSPSGLFRRLWRIFQLGDTRRSHQTVNRS